MTELTLLQVLRRRILEARGLVRRPFWRNVYLVDRFDVVVNAEGIVVDGFGSYSGVVEDVELVEVRPGEFMARVTIREVAGEGGGRN